MARFIIDYGAEIEGKSLFKILYKFFKKIENFPVPRRTILLRDRLVKIFHKIRIFDCSKSLANSRPHGILSTQKIQPISLGAKFFNFLFKFLYDRNYLSRKHLFENLTARIGFQTCTRLLIGWDAHWISINSKTHLSLQTSY